MWHELAIATVRLFLFGVILILTVTVLSLCTVVIVALSRRSYAAVLVIEWSEILVNHYCVGLNIH